MQYRSRTLLRIMVLAGLTCQCLPPSVFAGAPLIKCQDCICVPNTHSYGYYPARWRRWPDHHLFGSPTPAMMPHHEHDGTNRATPEELPDLGLPSSQPTPSENRDVPGALPPDLDLPDEAPSTAPETLPADPLPDTPSATPPPKEEPANPPAAEPATPALPPSTPPPTPPSTPNELPADPLAPPAEPDDDPVPALPQSLREPEGEEQPRLTIVPTAGRTIGLQSPVAEQLTVDETGLPALSRPSVTFRASGVQPSPYMEQASAEGLPDLAPQLLEPSPQAQPVDTDNANLWNRRRQNPLRATTNKPGEVQQAVHWQATAIAEPAQQQVAPMTHSPKSGTRAASTPTVRNNPLRKPNGGE